MQAYRDPYNPRIQQKFTMLVPSDDAWEVIHRTMGSAFKKLFMGEYSYNVSDSNEFFIDDAARNSNIWNAQVRQILERHLVVGQELSINNLTSQGRDNYLQTIRGKVKIVFVENGGGKFDFIQFDFDTMSTFENQLHWRSCQFIRC